MHKYILSLLFITIGITFEFEELVYDTIEGGNAMVMVCVNLVNGTLSRPIQVNVQPKTFDPLVDTASRKTLFIYCMIYASSTILSHI